MVHLLQVMTYYLQPKMALNTLLNTILCHPSSNGLAEWAVQTFMTAMKKIMRMDQ